MGWIGSTWKNLPGSPNRMMSEFAVKVYGSGTVVAYNYIANFHDGISHATYGDPDGTPNPIRERLPVSIDFYNNDITNVDDNCLEADGAAHNIRVLRNRCFNDAHRALSTQPVFGGPVYFIRNLVIIAAKAAGPQVAPEVYPKSLSRTHNSGVKYFRQQSFCVWLRYIGLSEVPMVQDQGSTRQLVLPILRYITSTILGKLNPPGLAGAAESPNAALISSSDFPSLISDLTLSCFS